MAFGTGTHETTTMCMRELEKYVTEDSKVFDIGCGSGILAIAAAKLGAKDVIAVDLDEARDVHSCMKEDAVFISSGIIHAKVNEVKESLIENGFEIIEVKTLGEWNAIVAKLK